MDDIFTRTRHEELINKKKYSWQTSINEVKATLEDRNEASRQFNKSINDNWDLREKNLVSSLNDIDHKAEINKLEWRKTVSSLERDCENLDKKRQDLAKRIEAMKRSEGIYRDGNYLGPKDKLKASNCATTISAAFRGNKARKNIRGDNGDTSVVDSYPAVYDDLGNMQKKERISGAYVPNDALKSDIDGISEHSFKDYPHIEEDPHDARLLPESTSAHDKMHGSINLTNEDDGAEQAGGGTNEVPVDGGMDSAERGNSAVNQDGNTADEDHLDASAQKNEIPLLKSSSEVSSADEGNRETSTTTMEPQDMIHNLPQPPPTIPLPPPMIPLPPPTITLPPPPPAFSETGTIYDNAENEAGEGAPSVHPNEAEFEAGNESAATGIPEVETPVIHQKEGDSQVKADMATSSSRVNEEGSVIGDLPKFESNRKDYRTSEAETSYRTSVAESDYSMGDDWKPPPPTQYAAQGNDTPASADGCTMSGWLLKKPTSAGSTFIKRKWKKRWLKLQPSNDTVPCPSISYFKGEHDKDPVGTKVILDCTVQKISSNKYKDKFPFDLLHGKDPKFSLMANTAEERESWIKAIEGANEHYHALLKHEDNHKPEAAAQRRRSSIAMSTAASSIGEID